MTMAMASSGRDLVRAALQWPARSQQGSRRNALVACTALAERRRERIEVEEFLERHHAARTAEPVLRPA